MSNVVGQVEGEDGLDAYSQEYAGVARSFGREAAVLLTEAAEKKDAGDREGALALIEQAEESVARYKGWHDRPFFFYKEREDLGVDRQGNGGGAPRRGMRPVNTEELVMFGHEYKGLAHDFGLVAARFVSEAVARKNEGDFEGARRLIENAEKAAVRFKGWDDGSFRFYKEREAMGLGK